MGPSLRRVLIVEDDPDVAEVVARYLSARGYEVKSVRSAEDAIALAGGDRFGAVLLDNALPGMTGLEAVGALSSGLKAPIIMMTGHYDDQVKADAILLGAAAIIRKPIEYAELEGELKKCFGPAPSGQSGPGPFSAGA